MIEIIACVGWLFKTDLVREIHCGSRLVEEGILSREFTLGPENLRSLRPGVLERAIWT